MSTIQAVYGSLRDWLTVLYWKGYAAAFPHTPLSPTEWEMLAAFYRRSIYTGCVLAVGCFLAGVLLSLIWTSGGTILISIGSGYMIIGFLVWILHRGEI